MPPVTSSTFTPAAIDAALEQTRGRAADRERGRAVAASMLNRLTSHRSRTSTQERRTLLVGMTTDPGLLAAAKDALERSAFGHRPAADRVIADALIEYHDQYQTCPGFDPAMAKVLEIQERTRLSHEPAVVPPEVEDILVQAYHRPPPGGQDSAYYRDLLGRVIADEQADLLGRMETRSDERPDPQIMAEWWSEAAAKVRSVQSSPPRGLIPTSRITSHSGLDIPTGIPFVDRTLEDGACQTGKTYGVLGPFGGGKTVLGVQILTGIALGLHDRGEPGYCAYVAYEDYEGVHLRTLQQLTGIARPSLKMWDATRDLGTFSTTANLHEYEQEHYQRSGNPREPWRRAAERAERMGERERWGWAEQMGDRFAIFDKSDPDRPEAGRGGVKEIEADLIEHTRRTGQPVRLVVLDYLKLAVSRFLGGRKTEKEGDLKRYSDGMMYELRDMARRLNCVVWVLQQMNAEANKKAEGLVSDHGNSAGSSAFGEAVWSDYVLGKSDSENDNVRQLKQCKNREGPVHRATVLRFDTWTATHIEDEGYTVSGGRIVGGEGMVIPPVQPTTTVRSNAGQYD